MTDDRREVLLEMLDDLQVYLDKAHFEPEGVVDVLEEMAKILRAIVEG